MAVVSPCFTVYINMFWTDGIFGRCVITDKELQDTIVINIYI